MAVAKAQYAISEITSLLRAKGVNVRFAIHPVAGRMPGQCNVLLAEASPSFDVLAMQHSHHMIGRSKRTKKWVLVRINWDLN